MATSKSTAKCTDYTVVKIDAGLLSGVRTTDGAVRAYQGVPYAQPPLGELRLRPPQPAVPWRGVRPADKFGPRCFQPSRAPESIGWFGSEPESEDCLTLNVWTGAASPDERRPVMVWFHGGAYYLGSGALPIFDGEQLARRGIILVTVNYRLGRLGFLAHPALSRESPQRASGNYGLMDQIGALAWVRNNIAAFGGDPKCVTIFGQSAGSFSVSVHMISPVSRGLFHRAIGQSGAAFGAIGDTSATGDCTQSLEAAEKSGAALAATLGAKTAAQLRALPARELQLAGRGADPKSGGVFDPARAARGAWDTSYAITDGYIVPESAAQVFARGGQHDVPLIAGTTENEGATMPPAPSLAAYIEQAKADYGAQADEFLRLYPAGNDLEARYANKAVIGDRNFIYQNWRWVRWQAATGSAKVFHYRYNKRPPFPPGATYSEDTGERLGAFHGTEIPYIFHNLHVRDWPWTYVDRQLSESISNYWANFARNGDPNGAGLPEWPQFSERHPTVMHFNDTPTVGGVPHLERLQFWEAFYERRGVRRS